MPKKVGKQYRFWVPRKLTQVRLARHLFVYHHHSLIRAQSEQNDLFAKRLPES